VSAPRIVCIEGGHGSGKSSLMWALSRALGARPHQHGAEHGASPWEAALSYAHQRAVLLRECEAEGIGLVVADRWSWSTGVLASVLGSEALRLLRMAERAEAADPALTLVCDAPAEVLRARVEARLAARGETWGEREAAERAEILRLARLRDWPVLDTTREREVVLAEAVGIVRGVL